MRALVRATNLRVEAAPAPRQRKRQHLPVLLSEPERRVQRNVSETRRTRAEHSRTTK